MSKQSILFAGGGTGGHIAPLLAVMELVRRNHSEISCIYVGGEGDATLLSQYGSSESLESYTIHAGKLHRFLTVDLFKQGINFIRGLFEARKLIKKLRPTVVFCKGGMVSVPIALAAWRYSIPVFSHETDLVPGLANRIIGRVATTIFTAYPVEGYSSLPGEKCVYTGQPVRAEFYERGEATIKVDFREIPLDKPLITVICGSQGAHRVNQLIHAGWHLLLQECRVVHICGDRDLAWLEGEYKHLLEPEHSSLFITAFQSEGIARLLQASTVVVSRAGGTIAELAAVSAAAVIIPLSTAAQDHQWANARYLEGKSAAVVIDEQKVTPKQLAETVLELVQNQQQRTALGKALHSLAHPEAAATMAELLFKSMKGENE